MKYTHQLRKTTEVVQGRSVTRTLLVRLEDGMIIGVLSGQTVAWGEDPREQAHRIFVDPTYALACLRKVADADWAAGKPTEDVDEKPIYYAAKIEEVDVDLRMQLSGGRA